jgi:hypothetical protein
LLRVQFFPRRENQKFPAGHRAKNIRIGAVVIAEQKFSDVKRRIGIAELIG